MRSYAEIIADLNDAKIAAAALNLGSVAARDVTVEHEAAAKRMHSLIREYNETWRKRGATNDPEDHAEWQKFDMRDMDGTTISAWVDHNQ